MADQEKGEELKKCAGCGKNVKKAKKYYRNGKYYCNFNCWRNASGENETKTEKAEA